MHGTVFFGPEQPNRTSRDELKLLAFPPSVPPMTIDQMADELHFVISHMVNESEGATILDEEGLLGVFVVTLSEFDSRAIGVKAGVVDRFLTRRVSDEDSTQAYESLLKSIDVTCQRLNLKFASMRIGKDPRAYPSLEASNWCHVDELETFRLSHGRVENRERLISPLLTKEFEISMASTKSEWIDACHMASDMFKLSRFAKDLLMPAGAQSRIYSNWISEAHGRKEAALFLGRHGHLPIGFTLARRRSTGMSTSKAIRYGTIDLMGVNERFRGFGVGGALLDSAIDWLLKHSDQIFVGSQHENTDAIRLYAKFGFEHYAVFDTFHKWYLGEGLD